MKANTIALPAVIEGSFFYALPPNKLGGGRADLIEVERAEAYQTPTGQEWYSLRTADGRECKIRKSNIFALVTREQKEKEDQRKVDVERRKREGFINENTFHLGTKANFVSCEAPDRAPDFVSKSGSEYWYTKDGVIRRSDHWLPHVATCDWALDGRYCYAYAAGFCKFADMEALNIFGEYDPRCN